MSKIQFGFYYGAEAEQFSFYRVPRLLIKDNRFKGLSSDAKLLYGLMLDRMALSKKNNWFDEKNRAYIIYTIENMQEDLGCSKPTIIKVMRELDESGIGLIQKKRRGLGKPDIIYVKNFASLSEEEIGKEPEKAASSAEVKDFDFQKSRNFTTDEVRAVEVCIRSDRDYLLFHLMLDCGLRRGEVLGLEWGSIDFEGGLLYVERTKSAKPRLVPVPRWLLLRLAAYRESCDAARPFDMTENAVKQAFKKLKVRSGVVWVHPHLLRHTFGTSFIYYKMGDLYRLSLLMGHKDIVVTCNYLHLAMLYDLKKVDIYRLDDVFLQ